MYHDDRKKVFGIQWYVLVGMKEVFNWQLKNGQFFLFDKRPSQANDHVVQKLPCWTEGKISIMDKVALFCKLTHSFAVRLLYKPHLFAEILGQNSWVRFKHETIAFRGSKLACKGSQIN